MTFVQNAVGWLVRRSGIVTLAALVLLFVSQSVLAFALTSNIRGLDGDLLIGMSALSLAVAWWLAQTRLRSGWALLIALGLGLPAIAVRVGGLADKLLALISQTANAYWSLSMPFSDPAPFVSPLVESLSALSSDVSTLWVRAQTWLVEIAQGRPTFDRWRRRWCGHP